MGTTRYGTRLSLKKSQVDSIGGGGGSDDRTIYTRTFSVSAAQLAAKGAVTTSSFTLMTLAAYEGVRWIWLTTETAFNSSGSNATYAKVGWDGGAGGNGNNVGLISQQTVTTVGKIDDNSQHSALSLQAGQPMGNASDAIGDASALVGDELTLKAYMETSANHDTFDAGLLYIHIEIVRYDPTQVEAST